MLKATLSSTVKWRIFALLACVAAVTVIATFAFRNTSVAVLNTGILNTHNAIKSISGDGSRLLYVFESSDCGFCRRLQPELKQLNNVTIYAFVLPGHSESSKADARNAWCAPSRLTTWSTIMNGGIATVSDRCDSSVIDNNLGVARQLGLSATPTIIRRDGRSITGFASASSINSWLNSE